MWEYQSSKVRLNVSECKSNWVLLNKRTHCFHWKTCSKSKDITKSSTGIINLLTKVLTLSFLFFGIGVSLHFFVLLVLCGGQASSLYQVCSIDNLFCLEQAVVYTCLSMSGPTLSDYQLIFFDFDWILHWIHYQRIKNL